MKVQIKQLPGKRTFAISAEFVDALVSGLPMRTALGKDAGPAGEGQVELDFFVEAGNIFASGTLQGWVELACSRCLCALRHPIEETLALTFLSNLDMLASEEPEAEEEALEQADDTFGYEGEELDLEQMIRERLLLAVPYAPHCKSDCLGLCSQCGSNLNDSECGCDRKVIDPRLAALMDIKV